MMPSSTKSTSSSTSSSRPPTPYYGRLIEAVNDEQTTEGSLVIADTLAADYLRAHAAWPRHGR
jgi:hypothetical protein